MTQAHVLLINPSIDPRTQKAFITAVIRNSFPLSLGYLAGYLMKDGFSGVQIRDEQVRPLDDTDLQATLESMGRPRIIGLTALTTTCGRVYELARKIKKLDPNTVIVVGGIHATVLPEEALMQGAVDVAVRGEGEIPFETLVHRILNESDFKDILGISYKANGKVIHNPASPLINDLNSLPFFPYHLFEENRSLYPGFFSIQTSRGCPYACVFCSQRSITGQTYRYVSTDRALHDIDLLVSKYDAKVIRILDDNIGANKRRLMELLDGIIFARLQEKVSFEAPLRGDNMTEEIADRLKQANFSLVSFGLETASERLMKLINKRETVQDVAQAIRLAAAKGIPTATTLIFGLPTETRKERVAAIRMVHRLPLDSVRYNILTPYPGTPIYSELQDKGEINIEQNWYNFSVQYMWHGDNLPYVPSGTDRYELMFTTMLANLVFYLRPSGIRKMLTRRFAGGNVVMLPRRWYLSSYTMKVVRVGFFLLGRFLAVFGKMILNGLVKRFREA